MKKLKSYGIKRIAILVIWIMAGGGTVLLLTAAVKKNNAVVCNGVHVVIDGPSSHFFVNEQDVEAIIQNYTKRTLLSQPIVDINLLQLEKLIERNVWVKNAELFFDINGILQVRINEREPIARIFTEHNSTYYIDSSMHILPVSENVTARVPVFTGFPSESKILNEKHTALLNDIRNISILIQEDEFLNNLTEQIDIQNGKFEIVPKIGDQIIQLGDAENIEEKLEKLKLFYKEAMPKVGFKKYSIISLQYKNQVVAKIRTKEEVKADSMRTLQLVKLITEYTERMADDTSMVTVSSEEKVDADISLILQSVQRDEEEAPVNWSAPPLQTTSTKPATVQPKPVNAKSNLPASKPKTITSVPVTKQTNTTTKPKPKTETKIQNKQNVETKPGQQPKSVMPPRIAPSANDY